MIKSMTAYGRAARQSASGQWLAEIHSVNRKMLDINLSLPHELLSLDLDVRKWIGEEVQRGQVTVRIQLASDRHDAVLSSLKELKKKWSAIAKELGYSPEKAIDFAFLTDRLTIVPLPIDQPRVKEDLKKVLQMALEEFIGMRKAEGAALESDLKKRLRLIRQGLKQIEKRAPQAALNYEKKLKEKIKEFVDDDRLMREVILFAEKCDVSEEITRLYSHLKQFDGLIASREKNCVGRTLDFLTQEMGREINTLLAKTADSEICRIAVTLKSEIEKIREQVQNVE